MRSNAPGNEGAEPQESLAVTATFTAEPLEEPLRFWLRELEIDARLDIAPLGQVFQQLLDAESLLSRNHNGVNLVLIRLHDWRSAAAGDEANHDSSTSPDAALERNLTEFTQALKIAAVRVRVPTIVVLCPDPPSSLPQVEQENSTVMERFGPELESISGVCLIRHAEIHASYPVTDYYDRHSDELVNIPYTQLYFTALATLLVRRWRALRDPPRKVIVMDCDNTLWKGICGEDGAHGVELDHPHRYLQQFMVAQHQAGMVLCLCSKNNETDVVAVFSARKDMPLSLDQITARRINWQPKSENIRALADELGLGLDSFIFIDDNPVECDEVAARCPGVLVLQLPRRCRDVPRFLDHCWCFDHLTITDEAQRRGALYQQHGRREALRASTITLDDFLAHLELEVDLREPQAREFTRMAELVNRTNQFNATTRRRSEQELRTLCDSGALQARVVLARDRFGDYGLVGVLLYRLEPPALHLDTFLLSCRALGRRIENRMIAAMADVARQGSCTTLNVPYIPTERNEPAREFLEQVAADYREEVDGGVIYHIPL